MISNVFTCNKETVDEYGKEEEEECIHCVLKKVFIRELAKRNFKLVLEYIHNIPEFSSLFKNSRYKEYIDEVCKK